MGQTLGDITLEQLFSDLPKVAGLVNQDAPNHAGNEIVLAPKFFKLDGADQNAILVHEVLHSYTGKNDVELAAQFGLGKFANDLDASPVIDAYLSGGCKKK